MFSDIVVREKEMTVKATHIDEIESTPEMQPETVLAEMRKLAASPVETVQKWAFLAILVLFGVFVYFSFQSNSQQPEKLFTLLEKQINQSNESLKVQEAALKEIQQFAIRVPIEHQTADVKLTMIASGVDKLASDNSTLRDAVKANTEAISKLIAIMEAKVTP